MAVISKISVGDIFYYTVDDIPTHVAPKGSVSILSGHKYSNKFIWVNNNGGSVWLKCIKPSYGVLTLNNGTTGVIADGTQTLGTWYLFNPTDTWTLNSNTDDFIQSSNNRLQYTGNTLSRFYVRVGSTLIAGSGKWISWEIGPSLNLTTPLGWQEGFGFDNAGQVNINSSLIYEMNTNGLLLAAVSPISREGGGGTAVRTYIPKYCQISAYKIDEGLQNLIFEETWESANFTQNSWVVANAVTNRWFVGTAENNTSDGSYSVYISNDNGVNNTYNNASVSISHFYKDFTFNNASNITLSFDWKCQGENAAGATQYDYGAVVVTTTATTPTAGSEVSTTQAAVGGNGRIGAATNLGKFNLNYGVTPGTTWNTETIDLTAYAGQTKRFVFTWVNDGSVGVNPPFVVDNIKITENIW
jgi:hypothetical protein